MIKRYFDVNVFVYYFTDDPKYGKIAYKWIKETEERLTSIITPFQVAIVIFEASNTDLRNIEIFTKLFQIFKELGVKFLSIDWDDVVETAAKYKIDLEDAIHVSAAIKENAEIITADKELQKKVNGKF